eukprot:m.872872 g.872872  ORF g.872872 m.872872 type:complete len:444 (+) comp23572_c1_seq11:2261-3592(+)
MDEILVMIVIMIMIQLCTSALHYSSLFLFTLHAVWSCVPSTHRDKWLGRYKERRSGDVHVIKRIVAMGDDRRRWSRPPAQPINPKGFASFGNSLGPLSDDDSTDNTDEEACAFATKSTHGNHAPDREYCPKVANEGSDNEVSHVNMQLHRLQENFEKLRCEREHMEAYCKLMQKNMDTKQELAKQLLSQNALLSQKVMTMEENIHCRRSAGNRPESRRKVLPKVPVRNMKSTIDFGEAQQLQSNAGLSSPPHSSSFQAPQCTGIKNIRDDKTQVDASKLQSRIVLMQQERDEALRECSKLKRMSAGLHEAVQVTTKGMTLPEQTELFAERVALKMELDELREELITAKTTAAKAVWEREHDRLYANARNRSIVKLLSRPLSAADRDRVIDILEGTTDGSNAVDDNIDDVIQMQPLEVTSPLEGVRNASDQFEPTQTTEPHPIE